VYRAVDQFGQVIDVYVSARRDTAAARRFFQHALATSRVRPTEVVTDRAAVYPAVLDELLPTAWHHDERYANNKIEADHGRLKHRLRPMRGCETSEQRRSSSADMPSSRTSAVVTTNSASTLCLPRITSALVRLRGSYSWRRPPRRSRRWMRSWASWSRLVIVRAVPLLIIWAPS
jgi:hypothetical protein